MLNLIGLREGLIEAITNALYFTKVILNSNSEIGKVIENMTDMIHNQLNNFTHFPIHSIVSLCKKEEKF